MLISLKELSRTFAELATCCRTSSPQPLQAVASALPEGTEAAAAALQQGTDAFEDVELVLEFDFELEDTPESEAMDLPDYEAVATTGEVLPQSL